MSACSDLAGEVRARALYGHRTAALIVRVAILILALLLALVVTSQSRADDGAIEDPLPFTIGGGLTVAALGALVLVVSRIQDLRAEKRRLEERVEALAIGRIEYLAGLDDGEPAVDRVLRCGDLDQLGDVARDHFLPDGGLKRVSQHRVD